MTQRTLFDEAPIFSVCRRYRYTLPRWVGAGDRLCLFVMLNPSTADEVDDDPTIRRCKGYARRWGYGRLMVVNMFAWRSTEPAGLLSVADPVGPENDRHVLEQARRAELVIAAWGTGGKARPLVRQRAPDVLRLLAGVDVHVLKTTDPPFAQPGHPLYLPKALAPTLLSAAGRCA